MAFIKKTNTTNVGKDAEVKNPYTMFVGMQISTATMETSAEFPQKKLKVDLPYDPAIPLLGMYPKGCKSTCSRDTCSYSSVIHNNQVMESA
jgi:hypothetical protein